MKIKKLEIPREYAKQQYVVAGMGDLGLRENGKAHAF